MAEHFQIAGLHLHDLEKELNYSKTTRVREIVALGYTTREVVQEETRRVISK